MGNFGFFALNLIDVQKDPAPDARTTISVFRVSDGREILRFANQKFPANPPRRYKLPAFPQEVNLYCQITPTRWRERKTDFFTLTHQETITRNLTVFRLPDKWQADFTAWNRLPGSFQALKDVLTVSPDVKVKEGRTFPAFTGPVYDGVSDKKTVLAKTALLNLFAKLSLLDAPGANAKWFSFVRHVLEIGRERLIAEADPQMGQIVRQIKNNIAKFPDYMNTPVGDHPKNFPAAYSLQHLFSIKSQEEHGNVQLTLAEARDAAGKSVLLLDTDIDENGEMLRHIGDLFKHVFTGGTHPYDIHEYLAQAHPKLDLGYDLV